MAVRESVEEALERWRQLELLQDHYAEFEDFLRDVIEDLMGFTCTEVQTDIGHYIANGPSYRMVQAQRGQAKTTITAAYAVWKLIHNPKTRVLIISAGDTQATEIANWIIQIIMGMDELECMRPDRRNGDRASVEAFDVHYSLKGPEKSPSVACIGITANMQGKRADLLIADDVESQKNSQTQTQRERLKLLTLDFTSICSKGDIIWLGTPQSIDSVYNGLPGRGYDIRIWTGRYPTQEELADYGPYLAPLIRNRLELDPSLQTGGGPEGSRGQPVDPVLLGEEDLIKKEIDQGAAYFQLQHMLSTKLSDQGRFPLKVGNIRLVAFDTTVMRAPMSITFARTEDARIRMPDGHPLKDSMYRVIAIDDFGELQGWHMYVDPAGGGQNGDETAYAVTGFCSGRAFLVDVGGVPGGVTEEALDALTAVAKRWEPKTISIEKNFGNGALSSVWTPRLLKAHKCGIEDVWESGQKELRIIDTLEPIIGAGKFVVHEDLIAKDWEECLKHPADVRSTYSLFWQMCRITRDRGSLLHEDRLDAVAGSVRNWVDLMAIDDEKSRAKAKQDQYNKMMKDPIGSGRPLRGQIGKVLHQPNALRRHGLR
ncbi:phage terminase large subunit [Kaustia mangrovi]|uniref:Phage terminase large subunit n=1 Tax=Kaustia mangrovi TaxID=2593653 RepID=A0A7S8HDR3_9HYPH|nr:phage terminase large subunit [Kaustia mangrovi]QPC44925.1 phage terminase large subunit [Kaustia mangrovi]